MSEIDDDSIEGFTMSHKLLIKFETKVEKLEKHLNNVPTSEDKDLFLKSYLAKDDNFTIALNVLTKPHDFDTKIIWSYRSDIGIYQNFNSLDYNDELILINGLDLSLRPKNLLYYINQNVLNKNLHRSYLVLKLFLQNDAFGM
jgi:hypothetical protein